MHMSGDYLACWCCVRRYEVVQKRVRCTIFKKSWCRTWSQQAKLQPSEYRRTSISVCSFTISVYGCVGETADTGLGLMRVRRIYSNGREQHGPRLRELPRVTDKRMTLLW